MKTEKSLRSRALELLGRGEYSRLQLARKLARYSDDEDEIAAVLDELNERGWQSDARFAEVLIHSKAPRLGNRRLMQELHDKGVDAELFRDALPDRDAQLQSAVQVLSKKFKYYQSDNTMYAKYQRFLAYRGFDGDTAHRAVRLWQEACEAKE